MKFNCYKHLAIGDANPFSLLSRKVTPKGGERYIFKHKTFVLIVEIKNHEV